MWIQIALGLAGIVAVVLLVIRVKTVRDRRKGWRVGYQGRDSMYYEELMGGQWKRITIDGEMLSGRAHHVINFGSKDQWALHPEWAAGRRSEIIARIKSVFRMPDYEYAGEEVLGVEDRQILVEAAGGLSSEQCAWAGCTESALASKKVCVNHAYPDLSLEKNAV